MDLVPLWIREKEVFQKNSSWINGFNPQSKGESSLSRFLPVCKNNETVAKIRNTNYWNFLKLNQKFLFNAQEEENYSRISRKNIFGFVPGGVDNQGNAIAVCVIANWKVKKLTLEDLFGFVWATFERHEAKAKKGVTILINMEGMNQQHYEHLINYRAKMFYKALQNCFPFAVKNVHIVGESPYIETLLRIVEPYLNEKIMKRITLHESTLDELKSQVPCSCLPQEFGGKLGPFKNYVSGKKKTKAPYKKYILLFLFQLVFWSSFFLMLNLEYRQKPLQETKEEDLENLSKEIQEFRTFVQEKFPDAHVESDDFLLKFLRAYLFDHEATFRKLRNYHRFRQEYKEVFENMDMTSMEVLVKQKVVTLMEKPQGQNATLLFMNLEMWDLGVISGYDLARVYILCFEKLSQIEDVQKNGLIYVCNGQGLGFYHLTEMLATIPMLIKYFKAVPIKLEGIFIYNQENQFFRTAFNFGMTLAPPDLKDKIEYVETYKELSAKLDSKYIPSQLGGLAKETDISEWIESMKKVKNGTVDPY